MHYGMHFLPKIRLTNNYCTYEMTKMIFQILQTVTQFPNFTCLLWFLLSYSLLYCSTVSIMSSERLHSARPSLMLRVMPIMIACAITWSIGSVTHFFDNNRQPTSITLATTSLQQEAYNQEKTSLRHETSTSLDEKQVYFLKEEHLHINDPFSATWLQPSRQIYESQHFQHQDGRGWLL